MIDKKQIIDDLWFLERNIVSMGIDDAFTYLSDLIPMTIHEYPTGQLCWTWVIPEAWECDEAWLENENGEILLAKANHPLHVISYSLPFEGEVTHEELFRHLHTHPSLPEAIPFVFKYYDRDWGLCCSQNFKDTLQDAKYKVIIRTKFFPANLKVAEIVVQGQSDESFVIVAHLCHPCQVNDDLPGVAVVMDLADQMINAPTPYYTYRFLILPETIGSVAWLSNNECLIPTMRGGLFLEMLGTSSPHALQHSFLFNSQPDKVFQTTLPSLDKKSYQGDYRSIINNDERQFNAPGVRVPMLSLSRVEPATSATRPYREYHSSFDTPEIISIQNMDDSIRVVQGLIEAYEHNFYVVNHFKGEIFCSGQKIWVDYRVNPEGHRQLFNIMERCDGEHTVADIADELKISFQSVWEVVSLLNERKLVSLSRVPVITDPHKINQ